jgi:TetR/AcrR family transcriptional regulator, transcriptional repressor for nem operon
VARKALLPTRLRLIQAAADLMWLRSYASAGVDDVCRMAAAQKGSFYHFFPTKSDLAVAAIDHRWDLLRRDVFDPIDQTGEAGLDRLARLVDRMDALQRQGRPDARAPIGSPIGALGHEMAHQDDRIRAAVNRVFEEHCRYLQRWLDEATLARQITAGSNRVRPRQVLALFEGALLLGKVAGDPDVFAQVCAVIPAVAGRAASLPGPPAGTAPELL